MSSAASSPWYPRRGLFVGAPFGSSAVRGVLRGLVEILAEISRPLLRPIARHAYLPLFYAFFVVWNVPEFPELRAGPIAAVWDVRGMRMDCGIFGPTGAGVWFRLPRRRTCS